MGTRADFYVGRGETAEWLGSIAYDGYPDGHPEALIKIKSEKAFRKAVEKILASVDHATRPDQGWPWPWDNSHTTDYAYAFFDGRTHKSCFGHKWCKATFNPPQSWLEEGRKQADVPDMSAKKNVTLGQRSGLMIITG